MQSLRYSLLMLAVALIAASASSFLIQNGHDRVLAEEAVIKENVPKNVTIDPQPNKVLTDLYTQLSISLSREFNRSTLQLAVEIGGEGLPGYLGIIANRTVTYVPSTGYVYSEVIAVGLKGGPEGLKWSDGRQALDSDLTVFYQMKTPSKMLLSLEYEGMVTNLGNVSLIDSDGKIYFRTISDHEGNFEVPSDYQRGWGIFDNGYERMEFYLMPFGGLTSDTFVSNGHFADTEMSPLLMLAHHDPAYPNVTFELSHLMDKDSVIENMDLDGIDADIVWEGRHLILITKDLDLKKRYNITITTDARSVYGQKLDSPIYFEIGAANEKEETDLSFVLIIIIVLVISIIAYILVSAFIKKQREKKMLKVLKERSKHSKVRKGTTPPSKAKVPDEHKNEPIRKASYGRRRDRKGPRGRRLGN